MATRAHADRGSDAVLAELFGADLEVPRAVLEELDRAPDRLWHVEDIADSTGLSLVDVAVAVCRLTNAGLVGHPDAGTYRALSVRRGRHAG